MSVRPLATFAGAPVRRRVPHRVAICLLAWGLVTIPVAYPQSATEWVFELHIEAGSVTGGPETLRVTRGDVVELRWSADEPLARTSRQPAAAAADLPASTALRSAKVLDVLSSTPARLVSAGISAPSLRPPMPYTLLEVHLHGYEQRVAVAPDAPALLRFEARATSRFPLTRHDTDGHGHATLLYLEVYPR